MSYFKKTNKRRFNLARSFVAGGVAFIFTLQTVAPVGWAVQESLVEASVISRLQVPTLMGSVDRVFEPKQGRATMPPMILIQDAHANPDAQKNIALILEKFHQENKIKSIGVEGAFGPVDSGLIRLFEDDQKNQKLVENLIDQGQLTGAELFGFNHSIPILGVDDPTLYEESYASFLKVKRDQTVKVFLDQLLKQQELCEQRFLPKELRTFVQVKRQWTYDGADAVSYFKQLRRLVKKYLSLDLSDAVQQFKYPQLVRMVLASQLEARFNIEKARNDIVSLSQLLHQKIADSSENKVILEALSQLAKEPLQTSFLTTSQSSSPRQFFERLYSVARANEIALLDYPALLDAAGLSILQSELNVNTLMQELKPLETQMLERAVSERAAKQLLMLDRKRSLLGKLLTLTLTFEDYETFLKNENRIDPQSILRGYAELLTKNQDKLAVPTAAFKAAVNFYRLSIQRDRRLARHQMEWAESQKNKKTGQANVLIAGGFHQTGILRFFESQNIPYALVTPRVGLGEDDKLYEEVMLGQSIAASDKRAEDQLNPQILLQPSEAYRSEASASGRRGVVIFDAMARLFTGMSRDSVEQALGRGEKRGFFKGVRSAGVGQFFYIAELQQKVEFGDDGRFLRVTQGEAVDHESVLPPVSRGESWMQKASVEPGFLSLAHYGAARSEALRRFASAALEKQQGSRAGARSEVRTTIDPAALTYLSRLGRDEKSDIVRGAINTLEALKQKWIDDHVGTPLIQNGEMKLNPLMSEYARSLPNTGPARVISVIEEFMRHVYDDIKLFELPIPYRAAFVMGALDRQNFPDISAQIQEILETVPLEIYSESQRLNPSDYIKMMRIAEVEHLQDIDSNILIRAAISRFIIDLPRLERRALEKEAVIQEFRKELHHPGTGDLTQIVFLTDLHGALKVGDIIARALGLKNYLNVIDVQDLERRLKAEHINLQSKNILFVGGSDYPDRGPAAYRAFTFVRWLRDQGKLKFINGNHDLWKDWNLFGAHLRVNDTLRDIINIGQISEADIEKHLPVLREFVTDLEGRREFLDEQMRALLRRLFEKARGGFEETSVEAEIQSAADALIDMGSNPNHSLEWWAREWYLHAGWADVMLDEININHLNRTIHAFNESLNTETVKALQDILGSSEQLPVELSSEAEGLLKNLAEGKLFAPVNKTLFTDHPEVKEELARIRTLKNENEAIRQANLPLAAEGRYSEMTPQRIVPTSFPVTSKLARESVQKMIRITQVLQKKLVSLPEFHADENKLATPENYRQNATVSETALWNMKNFRLVYVDIYGNAYLHGILPIDRKSMTFDVHYKGRDGIEAIEYMQYDVRRFFEKYSTIPNTPEFRREMQRETGEAFRILNEWYSDTLAHLKPLKVQEFLDHGGPAAFASSFTTSSAFSPRFFDPAARILHVGHVDLEKMKKQNLPWWVNGMRSGVMNGDRDISEEYQGLGAIITYFMRTPEGLKGILRLGYVKTLISLNKELKTFRTDLKKNEGLLVNIADEKSEALEKKIAALQQKILLKEEEIQAHEQKVAAVGGETIEDITLHELPSKEAAEARAFMDGRDLTRYYYQEFLKENLRDYKELSSQALLRNRPERARYYKQKVQEIERKLQVIQDEHFQKFFAEYTGRSWDSFSDKEMNTIETFYDFLRQQGFLVNWLSDVPADEKGQTRQQVLKRAVRENLNDGLQLAKAILETGVFMPSNESLNLQMLDKLGAFTRAVQNSNGGEQAAMTKSEIFQIILSTAEQIERIEDESAAEMPVKTSNDRERRDGRLEAGYRYMIPLLREMGRMGIPRLIEFLEPGFSATVRQEAGFALRGTDAISYVFNLAMNEGRLEDRQRFGNLLDKLGMPGREELLYFMHNDKGLLAKLLVITGNVEITFSDLLSSSLFKVMTDGRAVSSLESQIEKLSNFTRNFKPKDFHVLLKNWGLSAVMRWALDPKISEKIYLFEPLYEFEKTTDWNNQAFLKAVENAEARNNPEFTRGVLQLLLQSKDIYVLRGLVSLIAKDPTKTHLISFLISQMKLTPTVFAEDYFIQEEISKLLYSDGLGDNYYLIRKLASVIPHARRATGYESGIRNLAHEMDRRYDRAHALFRYLRLKLHASPSTSDGQFVETVISLLMNEARDTKDRRRFNSLEIEKAMRFFKDEAKGEVVASLQGDVAKRVGAILRSVAPDANDLRTLLSPNLDWSKAPHKDSKEFQTAKNLVDLFRQTESRYGEGLHSLDPERRAELDQKPELLLPEIQDWAQKRKAIKEALLKPGVFDPEDEMQVTKYIGYKRHIAEREWGFMTVGFYAEYRESRFEAFEEDRGYEHLIESLYDEFFEKRLPKIYAKIDQFIKIAQEKKSTPGVTELTTDQPQALPPAPREAAEELLVALENLVQLMSMDGTASPRLRHLARELRHPGLSLQQISNVLGLMQEELQLFLQRLLFIYGDYPAQTAATLGPQGVKPDYVKPGDESKSRTLWADRVQETVMAELFSEERAVQMLKRYLQSLREFLAKVPAESYLLTAEELKDSASLEPITKYNFKPERTSFVSVGSKGWELLDLSQRGFPVPPHAIIPAEAAPKAEIPLEDSEFRLRVINAILFLEKETGRVFPFDFTRGSAEEKRHIQNFRKQNNIDIQNAVPLILSARSGAPISMPGMMETAVNVPVTDDVVFQLMQKGFSSAFAFDLQRRFLFSFGTIHSKVDQSDFTEIIDIYKRMLSTEKNIPLNQVTDKDFSALDYIAIIRDFKRLILEKTPNFDSMSAFELLLTLVRDIYLSWESEGAERYQERFGISQRFGTAVTLQQMVYGNFDDNSGTAVIDSSDAGQGLRGPFGNVLIRAQGVELVAGLASSAQPLNRDRKGEGLVSLEETHPKIHREIVRLVSRIEEQAGIPVNTELTFESGKLYLLQARPQIVSASHLQRYLEPVADKTYNIVARGEPVSGNAAIGRILNARNLDTKELIQKVLDLRREMDQAHEEEMDIILVYDYFTDDDSSNLLALDTELAKLNKEAEYQSIRSLGILNSRVSQSNHASLIATKLGFAYVGQVEQLRFDDTGRVLMNDEVVPEGLAGDVYSIDAHGPLRSSLSGAVIKGAVPYTVRYPMLRSEVRLPESEPVLKLIKTKQSLVSLNKVQTSQGIIYETKPKRTIDVDDPRRVQQYLRQVYNALSDVAKDMSTQERVYEAHEVQVRDEFIEAIFRIPGYSKLLKKSVASARGTNGFVDTMDLYRILSKLRGKTEVAAYPDLRIAQYGQPQHIALVVDANVSDLEAVFFRDLVGNPDVALKVVVGTTPIQLAATLNHSIYRRFLRSGDVRYDQEAGWIEVLGRKIRVIKNEESLTGSDWQGLGVKTFVSTHSIRRRAEKIAEAVSSDTEAGEPRRLPVRIIALDNINPFKGAPTVQVEKPFSLNFLSEGGATKMEQPHSLLRAALLDVPVIFLRSLKVALPGQAVQNALYSLNYNISPFTALPLDESGRAKSPTQNQIPVSAEWSANLRGQLREALIEANLPEKGLQTLSLSSVPAPMGDRVELILQLRGQGINELLHDLRLERSVLRGQKDYGSVEKLIRQKFIEKIRNSLPGNLFQITDSREAVNTDTRFDRHIFVDAASLQTTVSQGIDNKLVLTLAIPLVFNRDWQNSRHLLKAIDEVARNEASNRPVVIAEPNLRLSPYGVAVDYANRVGTLPPAELEIPENLEPLREKPLQIGVVGFAGQIGARLHVAHDLNLNIAAAIGGAPGDVRNSFYDSIVGPIMSNGVILSATSTELQPHQTHQIGTVTIGEGSEIVLLRRYDNPLQIPWLEFGVEVVAETTGVFTDPTDPQSLLGHLELARGNKTGATAVILSAPFGKPKDKDKKDAVKAFPTVVFGANDDQVQTFLERAKAEDKPQILSNASCTTNCVATMTVFSQRLRASVTKLMREKYNLKKAELGDVEFSPVTSVHALTNTQPGYRDAFTKSSVESRHRAGPQATITKSGVSDAILQLNFDDGASFAQGATGYAVRVPIATSLAVVPFIFKIVGLDQEEAETLKAFNDPKTIKDFQADVVSLYSIVGREMAADPKLKDAVAFGSAEDVVTSEIVAGSGQMVIDAQQVHVLRRDDRLMVTGNAWYDNVSNYAQNYLRILRQMAEVLPVQASQEAAKSEVRALFGWGRKQEEPVSDNLVRGRISAELALAEIEDDTAETLDALLRMARAVLEEYTDFAVAFDERTVIEKVLEGTEHIDMGTAATNSMQWGNLENPGEGLVWVDKEVVKRIPKIVAAGVKRSEVRALFGWGRKQEEPVSDNLVRGRISAELALAEIEDDTAETLDALLRMARAVLEEYTDFAVAFDERTVIEKVLEGTEHIDMGTAATNSMQWGNLENPGEGLVWVDKEVVKKIPKIVPAGAKRSEVRGVSLAEVQGRLGEALSNAVNIVDRRSSETIDPQTREMLRQQIDFANRVVNDEDEVGDLRGVVSRLIDVFRSQDSWGERPAAILERILENIRLWEFTLGEKIAEQAKSEVRLIAAEEFKLRAELTTQGRALESLLGVAQTAALNTVEPEFTNAYPAFFRHRLFDLTRSELGFGETRLVEDAQLSTLREAMLQRKTLTAGEFTSEPPKTMVLASINGRAPVVDLEAMQFSPGSRVVILDSRGAAPVVWKKYEQLLPKGIRVERGTFEGSRPDLKTLKDYLSEKGALSEDQSARALLIFPYVTEEVLVDYSAIPLEDGLVVRTPRLARKSKTLKFAFSYLLGRGMLPAQLLKETPPDVFQVRVNSKRLSPAYVPLGSEGRFAKWTLALAARELLEASA